MLKKTILNLLRLFQTKENNKYNNTLALVFLTICCAFFIFLLIPSKRHLTQAEIKKKVLVYRDVNVEVNTGTARSGSRKTRFIVLASADAKYKLQEDLWSNLYSMEEILTTLRLTNKAVLWYFPDDSLKVLGLETEGIVLPHSTGVDLHNESRFVIMLLVGTCALLSWGFYLSPRILSATERNEPCGPLSKRQMRDQ